MKRTMKTLMLVMTLALASVGCASTGGGDVPAAAPSAPAEPPKPAKKPFEPPSFDAAVYENADLGFSVHYPTDFQEQPVQAGGLFSAASPQMVPRIDINTAPASGESIEAVGDLLAQQMATIGGGEATVTASKETTLQDGVTEAMEFYVDWSFQGFPIASVIVGSVLEDQFISVMVTGMQGGAMEDLAEIAYTFYLAD